MFAESVRSERIGKLCKVEGVVDIFGVCSLPIRIWSHTQQTVKNTVLLRSLLKRPILIFMVNPKIVLMLFSCCLYSKGTSRIDP